jgi:hypothetical protein
MRANRRTLVLLGMLLVTIALTWWIRSGGDALPATATAPPPRNAPGAAQQAAGAAGQTPIDVHIEALSAERQPPAGTGRNPFQFRARAAPPPPPPTTNTALSGPVTPPVPAGPPPAPPITLKFIGLVERAGGIRVAVLSDGHSPVTGQQGQVVLGRYRIVSIGVESIELEHADGRGRQTIRLTGQ